jgi:hypothetical protein
MLLFDGLLRIERIIQRNSCTNKEKSEMLILFMVHDVSVKAVDHIPSNKLLIVDAEQSKEQVLADD